ncbi:MAG TPA: RagB/SusD family nutrient uptake outer membrane protein [Gemmatimonadaceae bacterium]|nr:RagB/SusD family nutrient uptake outer membrane protein [Gemmatimonadaceae bacterium]
MLSKISRVTRYAVMATVLAGSAVACEDFLAVENPGAIQEPQLNDPTYIPLMVNGVIGEFQPTWTWVTYYNALFTDELRNNHVYFEERDIDRRYVTEFNGTYSFFYYSALQRSVFMGDSVASRLKNLLADSASRDLRLARVLAYSGYNYIMLGENLCVAPVNLSAPMTPAQLFEAAITRFLEAINVAQAARATAAAVTPATAASNAAVAGADSVINLARVGAARSYLNVNNKSEAISLATPVPSAFNFWAYYSSNSARENNQFYGRLSTGSAGSNSASVTGTPYENLNDPRVPHPTATERGMNAVNVHIPNSPSGFTTYNGTVSGADFTRDADMRVASGLEARYIVAEARGPTAETLTFVNERRAVGGQAAVALTGDALMAELREQRRRDLYLDNHRLGDLRRYQEFYNVDLWQTGLYPLTTTGETYDDRRCWPLPISELENNPNIP